MIAPPLDPFPAMLNVALLIDWASSLLH